MAQMGLGSDASLHLMPRITALLGAGLLLCLVCLAIHSKAGCLHSKHLEGPCSAAQRALKSLMRCWFTGKASLQVSRVSYRELGGTRAISRPLVSCKDSSRGFKGGLCQLAREFISTWAHLGILLTREMAARCHSLGSFRAERALNSPLPAEEAAVAAAAEAATAAAACLLGSHSPSAGVRKLACKHPHAESSTQNGPI